MGTDPKYVARRYRKANTPGSLSGLSGFIINNPHYKDKSTVEAALAELDAYSLHKPTRVGKRRVVWVNEIDHLWAADVVFYPKYSRSNNSTKYILLVVDCFSKFLMAEGIKNKTSDDVVDGFKAIFKRHKRKCQYLWTDFGGEFFGKKTVSFLESNGIKIYKVYTPLKSSIAERYVRRLKTVIERHFTDTNSHRYIDVLQDIVNGINQSYNRSIKMKPASVTKKNESEVWFNLYERVIKSNIRVPKYKVGEKVRISEKKIKFIGKGYSRNWTKEIFSIKSVRNLIPVPVYILQDTNNNLLQGSFYEFELQVVP
jgi:hypothetical protein